MYLTLLGLSHKTADMEFREKFYLSDIERELLLAELKLESEITECFVISTCNRTEIYAMMKSANATLLLNKLCRIKKIKINLLTKNNFYVYFGEKAVRHLFSLSAGLESLVIGEKEILGQLKASFNLAREKNNLGRNFNILTNIVLQTGKKVRNETHIGSGGLSVSWAAVEMASGLLESLAGKSVLIIGAGKMSHLAASDFKRKKVKDLFIMNRTLEKGAVLASKIGGKAVVFSDLFKIIKKIDVCICSASAPHYLVEKELILKVMQTRQKKLILIDISMPRNIH
ncbi:MAG: glutamyl-tRNA reductase, partial [Candidatus Omnitrophica bacterium]|nr:glutamyl-tRNA reductase [Candidatus Omnitrophota bacterium]